MIEEPEKNIVFDIYTGSTFPVTDYIIFISDDSLK